MWIDTICEVPKNGDCLFSSVIHYLRQVLQSSSDLCLLEHLQSIGIRIDSLCVGLLRNLMVDEWIGNQQEYIPFLDDTINFEQDADNYRASGIYTTSLGDAMLLGLSNVLRLQIIVFTSIPSWPYLTVNPHSAIASKESMT